MNAATFLLRMIHPSFVNQGRVSSQAFRPTPKDESKLSVYDGDLIRPEAAFAHFTAQPRCRSCGTQAVTVAECTEASLVAASDPEPFPEHAIIDFSGLSKTEVEKKAKQLRSKADARGWLFRPEAS